MKTILFVCVENSCRSQMAEGFARHFGQGVCEVASAGSRPSGVVNPDAIKAMAEVGIDISSSRSRGFGDLPGRSFDYVVTMGCKDTCPFVAAREHIDWDIRDPKGLGMDDFRQVRDDIRDRVRKLMDKCVHNQRG